jgi:dihydrofolate synthase/folylpolyglutamate synthase
MASAITSIAFGSEKYLIDAARYRARYAGRRPRARAGALAPEALAAIEDIARGQSAELIRASEGVTIEPIRPGSDTTSLRLRTPTRDYGEIDLSLHGAHQVANALVAVRVLEVVDAHGLTVPTDAVVSGLANVSWPGRVDRRTLPDGRELILDAAHNPAGAAALAAYLAGAGRPKLPLVFAAMRDKDVGGMFLSLLPAVGVLIVTRASNPRID